MDMYYRLKDELLCQDCKIDLKFEKRTGHGYFDAVCVACGHRYEIEIFTKPKWAHKDQSLVAKSLEKLIRKEDEKDSL